MTSTNLRKVAALISPPAGGAAMATKYVLIFLLNSTSPETQYLVDAWSRPFDSYQDCLKGASEVTATDAIVKECKPIEVPGTPTEPERVKPPG